MVMADMVHRFERAGLGVAPFRFVGLESHDQAYGQVILNRKEYERTGVMVSTRAGGTCAYCGQGIVNMYGIQSADGRRFHVGSECVNRTGDAGLKKTVAAAIRKLNAAKRAAKDARVRADLAALMADAVLRAKLAGEPHPNAWRREQGDTRLDEVEFALSRCGAAGRARWLRTLRALAA